MRTCFSEKRQEKQVKKEMIGKLEFPFGGGGMIKKECRDEMHFVVVVG